MSQSLPSQGPRIVVLTGAGVSAESGVPTFRGAGGLWEQYRAEELATPEAFARDPALVHRFYNHRRRGLLDPAVQPNPAHQALAQFDREYPGEFLLVSQNVDDLHQRAGSQRLLAMHGQLMVMRCEHCGWQARWEGDCEPATPCPGCHRAGTLRPNVVWFGEIPHGLETIDRALNRCDLFVAIGTSGNVYPAAGFVRAAKRASAHTVALNLEAASNAAGFDEHQRGPASQLVPAFFQALLEQVAASAR